MSVLTLRQGCSPGQAGLCPVFKVQQESAMPLAVLKRPCTRWLSLQALCPLLCRLYQPPSCQCQAGLPGSASSTLRSTRKFSSSVCPDQQLSMSAFTGVLGPCWASGKSSVLAGTGPWLSSGTPTASNAKQTCDCLHACFLLSLAFLLSYCNIIHMQ